MIMIKGAALSCRGRCLNLHVVFYVPGPVQVFALTTAIRPLKIIPHAEMGGPLGKPLVVSVVGDNQFTDAIELHKRHGDFPTRHVLPHITRCFHYDFLTDWNVAILL